MVQNSKANIVIAFYTIILFILLIASCASKPENLIIGKWEDVKDKTTIEFLKDGTCILVERKQQAVVGKYNFIDNNRLKVDIYGMSRILQMAISENELILTFPDGAAAKHKRVKQ